MNAIIAAIFESIDRGEYHAVRPLDMLLRQLLANRMAARYRRPSDGKRHHAHLNQYRRYFINDIRMLRHEIISRGVQIWTAKKTAEEAEEAHKAAKLATKGNG